MNNISKTYFLNLILLAVGVISWNNIFAVLNNNTSKLIISQINQIEPISILNNKFLIHLKQYINIYPQQINFLNIKIQKNRYLSLKVIKNQKQKYVNNQQQIKTFNNQAICIMSIMDNFISTISKISYNDDIYQNIAISSSVNHNIKQSDSATVYNRAVILALKKKQYVQAIDAFQEFIKLYPKSIYQPNANYWLGQLNYNRGEKDKALYFFACVAKKYPKSAKAADSLLKIGMIMQEKKQKDKADIIYKQIIILYPNTNVAKRAEKYLKN